MFRPVCAFAALLLAVPLCRADLIFESGGPASLTTPTAEPLIIRDSPAGSPTALSVTGAGRAPRADVFGGSSLSVGGGGIVTRVETFGTSTATVLGSPLSNPSFFAHEDSVIAYNALTPGGLFQVNSLFADGNARIVAGGGEVGGVTARGSSRIDLGVLRVRPLGVSAFDDATVNILATFGSDGGLRVTASGTSEVNWRGIAGQFSSGSLVFVTASDEATVTLFGTFDRPNGEVTDRAGDIRVTSGSFTTTVRFARNDNSRIILNGVTPVPEPSALALLGGAAAGLAGWVWRRQVSRA